MGFLSPKTPARPLDEGKTPQQLAEAQRQQRLKFRGAGSTTLAGNTKQNSDQKSTLGGSV